MEWEIGKSVAIDPTEVMILERARTNKLKCSLCKNQIKKGQSVLLHYNREAKITLVNCCKCPDGVLGYESFYDDVIMEDVYGIGQWNA